MEGLAISRNEAERRMLEKLRGSLLEDVEPLLPVGICFDEPEAMRAFEIVWRELILNIPGEPWRLTEETLEKLRKGRYPKLLAE